MTSIEFLWIVIFGIGFYIFLELYISFKNKRLKQVIIDKLHQKHDGVRDEQLEYYKNKNIISFLRFFIVFFLITFYILHRFPNFFNFFSIAVGAVILTFKDIIVSFFAFFYILTQYKIGDHVGIYEWWQFLRWEIIYINILNIGIVGKDENGEHNGQLYKVPNAKFLTDIVRREEITLHAYKLEKISIPYKYELYSMSFDEFTSRLCNFLDTLLSVRTLYNAGNYKTFIGYKYKLRFQYLEKPTDGIVVKVFFVEKAENISSLEKNILSFVESLKVPEEKKE